MKGKMKEKMKRDRDERKDDLLLKKCFKTLQPARRISPRCFEKKSLSDELFLHFSSKVQNLTVFSIIYMIRIPFFGPGELIQRYFRAARYALSLPSSTGGLDNILAVESFLVFEVQFVAVSLRIHTAFSDARTWGLRLQRKPHVSFFFCIFSSCGQFG